MPPFKLNIAQQRLESQRLVGKGFRKPADVVRWLGAVQSQDYAGAKWGVAVRMHAITDAAIDAAFSAGELLRTHILRPTWHLVTPEDLRWMLALTGPRGQAANARVYRGLELDEVMLKRARAIITRALRDGNYLTRAQLGQELAAKKIPATGQRLAYVIMHCELDAMICSGPLRAGKHTYALVDERAPAAAAWQREELLGELARRYFTSHGPATAHDFAWWSGLTVRDARLGAEIAGDALHSVEVDGKRYWLAARPRTRRTQSAVVHLLPNYDEHVVAYRDHAPSLDPQAPDALAGWGNAQTTHLVARNGLVVGGWRRTVEGDHAVVRLRMRVRLQQVERRGLERAAAAYGRFLGRPVRLEQARTSL